MSENLKIKSLSIGEELSAICECGHCCKDIEVEASGSVTLEAGELEFELVSLVIELIEQGAKDAGWNDGYCPDCLRNRQDQIFDAERADEDRGWEEAV